MIPDHSCTSIDDLPVSDLHMHHTIEEMHVFPVLATRMPEFKPGSGNHLKQRKQERCFCLLELYVPCPTH